MPLSKNVLRKLYIKEKKSSAEISKILKCSERMVNYWISAHGIPKRSISEAVYLKNNPNGDPFKIMEPKTMQEAQLLGLGLGLFWGEGNKKSKGGIRLGNTDPYLLKVFIKFLNKIYGVDSTKLRFGLQIFSDMKRAEAVKFWRKFLNIPKSQLQKVIVTPARGIGTYREKTKHGVLSVQCYNTKLRNIICEMIDNLKNMPG